MKKNDIVYFELNNWFGGIHYPDEEPFISWMENFKFEDLNWVIENQLCVHYDLIVMSSNYCITAKREWVEKKCPRLLNDSKLYNRFVREPKENNKTYGKFGHIFLEYEPKNIGIFSMYEDVFDKIKE